MTDKATVELTSPVAGVVASIHGEPGAMSAVGAPLVILDVEGAGNASDAEASAPTPAPKVAPAAAPTVVEHADEGATTPQPDGLGLMGNYLFKLPDVGEGTAEAELVEWKVKLGDHVAEDQPLADVMTDKATVELTSPVAGKVVALNGEPGKMVAVGSAIVGLEVAGAGNVAASAPKAAPAPAAKAEAKPAAVAKAPEPKAAPRPVAASSSSGGAPPAFATRTANERPQPSTAVCFCAFVLG